MKYQGRKLVGLKSVGSAMKRGVTYPGFAQGTLDDGQTIYVPEADCKGFDGAVGYIERQGVDAQEFRQRLDQWVKTGTMPPAQGAQV